MSRVGLNPISLPEGVTVNVSGSNVNIKGPEGELNQNECGEFRINDVLFWENALLSQPYRRINHRKRTSFLVSNRMRFLDYYNPTAFAPMSRFFRSLPLRAEPKI